MGLDRRTTADDSQDPGIVPGGVLRAPERPVPSAADRDRDPGPGVLTSLERPPRRFR